MKKIFIMAVLFIFANGAFAETVKVEALSDFSTKNPPHTWQIILLEDLETENNLYKAGSKFEGTIEDVTPPKRLKRDATFKFRANTYEVNDEVLNVKEELSGKYAKGLSVGDVAMSGVTMVGNKVIGKAFGAQIAVAEGIIRNEQHNVVKSVAVNLYKRTPLSYCSKGKDVVIESGNSFKMKF